MIKASTAMTSSPIAVDRETFVYEAIGIMVKNDVTGLPVVNADGTVAGVISEKDVLKLRYNAKDHDATVEHFMTEDVVTFDEDDSLIDITECFIANSFRRVFITSGGKISGVISRRDIIRYILNLRQRKQTSVR